MAEAKDISSIAEKGDFDEVRYVGVGHGQENNVSGHRDSEGRVDGQGRRGYCRKGASFRCEFPLLVILTLGHTMPLRHIVLSAVAFLLLFAAACDSPADDASQPESPPSQEEPQEDVEYRWMPDGDAEKFLAIEGQMGGFSKSMRRVGYRYNELYWAADDQNWDFASYQLEKLESELRRGTVRRPGREASARSFLDDAVPALQEVIDAEDGEAFEEQFEEFTMACNTCHGQEGVPFIQVQPLDHRLSPVRELSQPAREDEEE